MVISFPFYCPAAEEEEQRETSLLVRDYASGRHPRAPELKKSALARSSAHF
jgi:hypothetical protein